MLKFFDFSALVLYCSLIYWLSDQSSLPVLMTFEFQDKLHHMIAYFVMGMLAWRSFRHFSTKVNKLEFGVVLFCSLYGLSDEWHQSFVVGRSSDLMDWIADTFGAAFAAYMLSRYFTKHTLSSLYRGKTVQNP